MANANFLQPTSFGGGGVVAELFSVISRSRPHSVGGGGGGSS